MFSEHKVLGGLSGFFALDSKKRDEDDLSRISAEYFGQNKDWRLDRFFSEEPLQPDINSFFNQVEDSAFEVLKRNERALEGCVKYHCVEIMIHVVRKGAYPRFTQAFNREFEQLLASLGSIEHREGVGLCVMSALLKFSASLLRATYQEMARLTNHIVAEHVRRRKPPTEEDSRSEELESISSKPCPVGIEKMLTAVLAQFPNGTRKEEILEKLRENYGADLPPDTEKWKKSVSVVLASSPKIRRVKGLYFYHAQLVQKSDFNQANIKGKLLTIMTEFGRPESLQTLIDRYRERYAPVEDNVESSLKKVINRYDIFDKSLSKVLYQLSS
jgi:hypothetical protein